MKNKKKIFFSFAIVVVFFVIGFFLIHHTQNLSPTPLLTKERGEGVRSVLIAGQIVKVDLAISDAEQTKGLSGRKDLASDEGMLFIFNKPDKYLFWMKDMNFPIDIIWLAPSEGGDASKVKVVYIKKDARPELYPETYGPAVDAKYVLEVIDGFSDQNNLKEGDTAQFIYQ